MWETSELQTRQLSCINRVIATRLADAGISTMTKLKECDPRELEKITKRSYPFGGSNCNLYEIVETRQGRQIGVFSIE